MAKIERVTYFLANIDDRPGTLLRIMRDLKGKNINLAGLWGFATYEGKAQLYVVPKSPDKLRNEWKASGLLAEEGVGFLLKGADRAGALLTTLEALANAGVNMRAIDAVAVSGQFGSFIWVHAADEKKAAAALGLKK